MSTEDKFAALRAEWIAVQTESFDVVMNRCESPIERLFLAALLIDERTKAQAKSDKSRDRALTAAGWRVIRFTGSEVYASPHRCVQEAVSLAESLRIQPLPQTRRPG